MRPCIVYHHCATGIDPRCRSGDVEQLWSCDAATSRAGMPSRADRGSNGMGNGEWPAFLAWLDGCIMLHTR